ncbi:MAG TPA: glycosyltransferase family 1 protein [Terriglobales bacterium]|nr:glycosyltransferase family 1 protein [Terriglobales bacterium]
MRIGVDATCWSNRRGYGRFARALLSAVLELDRSNQYVFFADDDSPEFPFPACVELVRVRTGVPTVKAAAAEGHRGVKDLWTISRVISGANLDLVFFPSIYSYVPLTSSVPKLVTIHDVIPELYPELVFPTLQSRLFWWAKVKLGCAQARLILTVSEYSRRCLAEHLGIAPERLRVVQEASAPAFQPINGAGPRAALGRLGVREGARLLAYVGGFSPHKNLGLVVDVLRELRADSGFADLQLVLVGDYTGDVFFSNYLEIRNQVRELGLEQHVVFSGYLGDEDMVQVLNAAEVLLLPSFCEGVGLPALEAAACGTPVVVTRRSPLPELLGAGAIALEPEDRVGWREAVRRILQDPQLAKSMRAAGLEAVSRLSWRASARQLLAIFEEVAGGRSATA